MRIAIDVNGVLRDTLGKFKEIYEKNLMSDCLEESEKQSLFELTESGETLEIQEEPKFTYGYVEPVTSLNLQDFYKFQNEDEYYNFLYEEFPMQIFGHAGSTEMLSFNELNNFYLEQRENHDIFIVSDEIGKSKPATLFFLSKFGCLTEKVKFFSKTTEKSLWDELDILLTANPDLLLNHPQDKVVIKFNTTYNQNVNVEYNISQFKELHEIIKKIIKC